MPGVLSLDAEGNARALQVLNRDGSRSRPCAIGRARRLVAWSTRRLPFQVDTAGGARPQQGTCAAGADLASRSDVLAVVGTALTLLHDMDAAEQVIGKALAIDAGWAWAWGQADGSTPKGERQSAIERFTIALELAPNDALAFNNMVGIGSSISTPAATARPPIGRRERSPSTPQSAWIHRTLCRPSAGRRQRPRRPQPARPARKISGTDARGSHGGFPATASRRIAIARSRRCTMPGFRPSAFGSKAFKV